MTLNIHGDFGVTRALRSARAARETGEASLRRLSTGRRINSTKEDAANRGVSVALGARMRSTQQAYRNASDALGMLSTADAAYARISGLLQRARELAVRAANGVWSSEDRQIMQHEVDRLLEALDRTARETAFAGQTLLDGTLGRRVFQVGPEAEEQLSFELADVRAHVLGFESETNLVSPAQSISESFDGGATGPFTAVGSSSGSAFSGTSGQAVEFRSAVERYFETPDVDASAGGVFSFRFIYGDGSNGGEDVDLGDEVFVRASTNGGATWTTVATLDLATWKTGSYEDVDIAITGALRAPNVRFRVEQDNFITGNADTWAIDQASLSVAEITSTTTRPAVGDIDVSTSGRAGTAVSTVDRALDQLGAHRAAVGALQGRLESRIEHLGSMHANQAAAHGRITNADFAAETASLVRSRILTEASMAMLVEARGQRALIADLLGEL